MLVAEKETTTQAGLLKTKKTEVVLLGGFLHMKSEI